MEEVRLTPQCSYRKVSSVVGEPFPFEVTRKSRGFLVRGTDDLRTREPSEAIEGGGGRHVYKTTAPRIQLMIQSGFAFYEVSR